MTSAPSVPRHESLVVVLPRSDICRLMTTVDYLTAVEAAFLATAEQGAFAPSPLHLPAGSGAFHAKGAIVTGERSYAVLKFNGNFPANPHATGLPTIQGVIVLCDADDGRVLALLDSQEITLRRTAAASVLAAKHLARAEAEAMAVCGCGAQGRGHLEAFVQAFAVRRVFAWDGDADAARSFAQWAQSRFDVDAYAVASAAEAAAASDIVVTCTTARAPFLGADDIEPGTFIAAVGADDPQKNELAPALLAAAKVVADVLSQCAAVGDLHHAIEAGLLTADGVHAELAEVVAGHKSGRTDDSEITVFDSTGTAIADAASAARVYERALVRKIGSSIALGE